MNPRDPNVQQLQIVAKALGHLRETLVLVGGCATGVLITDNARPPVRATQDVDLIAEIATKAQYYELAADLRELGFREDTEDVICRWRLGDLKVDVMPSSEGVLNFTNKWYSSAIEESIVIALRSAGNHARNCSATWRSRGIFEIRDRRIDLRRFVFAGVTSPFSTKFH